MKVTLRGTRGSVGRAGPGTVRYGGDTSSAEVVASDGTPLLLDAGSGIVHTVADAGGEPLHLLLTHLHMDHIQGLGFFRALFDPTIEVHLWGPISIRPLADRLARYLSPPLFPVRLRDLPATVVHDLAPGTTEIGPYRVTADFVIHPGQTYGYRIEEGGRILTYIPDHEPALGAGRIPPDPRWISGHDLADGADMLIHDAQYNDEEYKTRVGWGHSTVDHAADFARTCRVGRLVTFHHEPDHSDEEIDRLHDEVSGRHPGGPPVVPGLADATFEV